MRISTGSLPRSLFTRLLDFTERAGGGEVVQLRSVVTEKAGEAAAGSVRRWW